MDTFPDPPRYVFIRKPPLLPFRNLFGGQGQAVHPAVPGRVREYRLNP
ncbi:hypothetical protein AGMMS4952_21310 [Spirochaetia bacterium]|nr:hypothetical protein AGMMS4952_21310 [Spirochaetia bacterium]